MYPINVGVFGIAMAASIMVHTQHVEDIKSEREVTSLLDSGLPVVGKFYGPWCRPCRESEGPYENIAQELSGKAYFVSINIDKADKSFVKQYAGKGVPTFVIFSKVNGVVRVASQSVGYRGPDRLREWILENTSVPGSTDLEKKNEVLEADESLPYIEETVPVEEVAMQDDALVEIPVETEVIVTEPSGPGFVGSIFQWAGDTVNSFFDTLFGR